jgi:hypothetical protein
LEIGDQGKVVGEYFIRKNQQMKVGVELREFTVKEAHAAFPSCAQRETLMHQNLARWG